MIKPDIARSIRAGSPAIVGKGCRYPGHPSVGKQCHQQLVSGCARTSRPLVGNFEENILNNRLEPVRTVEGYTAEVRASCNHYQPSPLRSCVKMSFFSMGDSFPYLGRVHLGSRGYRIPKRGTIQVTLFNPHGTLVKLFLLLYDLTDMPPNSQTFLRQKTLILMKNNNTDLRSLSDTRNQNDNNDDPNSRTTKSSLPLRDRKRVKYLIQLNIVSSKSGRVYLNGDVRIFISKRTNLETASQLVKQDYEIKAFEEMPNNPRYFSR